VTPQFVTPLDMRRFHGTRKRQLLGELVFRDSRGKLHSVPQGFIYNGVSFPVMWGGAGEAGSALHDHAYTRPDLYTRAEADALLREALEAEGMNALRRGAWWLGVRAIGWNFYGKEKEHEDASPIDHSPGA
jgi:hypothetical protein